MTDQNRNAPHEGAHTLDISMLANAAEAVEWLNERLLSGDSINIDSEFPELHPALKLALKAKDPAERSEVFLKNIDADIRASAFAGEKDDGDSPASKEEDAVHHGAFKRSNAQQLIDMLIAEGLQLLRDHDSVPYAIWKKKLHGLNDDSGPNLVGFLAFERGAGVDEAQAVRILKAKAQHDPDIVAHVYRRFAPAEDGLIVGLFDGTDEVIHISKEKISIEPKPQDIFLYETASSLPMVRPEFDEGFSVEALLPFFNIEALNDLRLLLSWAACAMFHEGPHPIFHIMGTAGSGKTEALKKIRKVIDPDNNAVRAIPEGQDRIGNFAIGMQNNSCLMADNVKRIDDKLANLLCIISTGGSYVKRSHYSNTGETAIKLSGPVAFTSVGPVTTASDLLDRIIAIHVPPIPMGKQRTQRDMDREFELVIPKVLGMMCQALQRVLLHQDEIDVSGYEVRMLDFQKRIAAMAPVFGWDAESAMQAMVENATKHDHDTLENSVLYKPIIDMLKMNGWKKQGIMSEILEAIELAAGPLIERQDWPTSPQQFGADLAYIEPALKKLHGVVLKPLRRKGSAREKLLYCPDLMEPESEPVATQPQQIQRGFADVD